MSEVWLRAENGDLLRADQVRQINVDGALDVLLVGGSRFVLARVTERRARARLAVELAAVMADAAGTGAEGVGAWASLIEVVRDGDDWQVTVRPLTAAHHQRRHIEQPAPTLMPGAV